jgi:hypothetical protein
MSISAEVITYDFDEIEVIYAAEFMVNITGCEENWFTDLAGKDNSVSVLYGIVSLSNSTDIIREEFIKVTGAEGTERFLLTSDHYDYYEDGVTLKAAKSFFWSAKRIVGTDIVKDFTLPIISLTLYRDFNLDSSLRAISVYPSNDGMTATEEFWRGTIPEGTIPVDLSTLYYYGDPSYISL